ncbi:MAG TPA: hypothetical protein PKD19_03410 [Candidatus Saccharibacteria bacterium]|nr:hypothetical protein [Candidatus Saccharibacteria bacterium]
MEFLIGIGIAAVIVAIADSRKKHKKTVAQRPETPEERKLRETDELIAVVLPTINHDK